MNRYPPGGRSKASATTLCQKCLKTGHYSYECKAPAQERPYVPRPSRTQQLLNPKLMPKLMSDVPSDFLRKEGVADQILSKNAQERDSSRMSNQRSARKRSRSVSSVSSSSISTISTNLSRSPSPELKKQARNRRKSASPFRESTNGFRGSSKDRKRRRRSRSSSYSSRSHESHVARKPRGRDANTRRRLSSFSPHERGRRRSRSVSSRMERSRSPSQIGHRNGKATISQIRRSRSRSVSRHSYRKSGGHSYSGRDAPRIRMQNEPSFTTSQLSNGSTTVPPPRERSLSPYSKRLAMTQAMNMSR